MSVQQPPSRLADTQQVALSSSDVERSLADGVDVALHLIDAADGATVAAADNRVIVATSEEAAALAELQMSLGLGPTVDALHGRVARINYMSETEWPEVKSFCDQHKIRSVLALPVLIDGNPVASLTITSVDHHAFGANEIRVGRTVAQNLAASMMRWPSA